jgi:hypothetical protein
MNYLTVTVKIGQTKPADVAVFRVKDYHTLMPLQGSADIDNFQAIKLASFDGNDPSSKVFFNDTAKYQVISESYLRSIQIEENIEYGSVDQKMRWLINDDYDVPGSDRYHKYNRPYWRMADNSIRFGTILFGQTDVQVEAVNGVPVEYIRNGKYPAESAEDANHPIRFYRVIGSRDWIVNATAVEGGKLTDRPRGTIIYHPVWSSKECPVNGGDGENYIAVEFLE